MYSALPRYINYLKAMCLNGLQTDGGIYVAFHEASKHRLCFTAHKKGEAAGGLTAAGLCV